MPVEKLNGVDLYYEVQGTGPPLVVVHGGWTDHTVWQAVAEQLEGSHRVVRYDRRGYSRSGDAPGQRTRRQDEDDLASMIETVAGSPASVLCSSFGGLVTLGLLGRRSDLLVDLCVHEAPSVPLAGGGEPGHLVDEAMVGMAAVVDQIESGDAAGGARKFVEELGLGPGAWEMLPDAVRDLFVSNASAVAAEQRDSDWATLDIPAIENSGRRILLTKGTTSPRWLQALQDRLAEALPGSETAVIEGAGHSPHMTHPQEFAGIVGSFLAERAATPTGDL